MGVLAAIAVEFLVMVPFKWAVTTSLRALVVDNPELIFGVVGFLPLLLPAVEANPTIAVISPIVCKGKGISTASITG